MNNQSDATKVRPDSEHADAEMKHRPIAELERGSELLRSLFSYLVREYPDDQWDGSTREMLQDIAKHLGESPLKFDETEQGTAQFEQRDIFSEAMQAKFISTSVFDREDITVRRDLLANEILGRYPREAFITREWYDEDSDFGECLISLNAFFEFPNWEGRTVGEFVDKHGIAGEPVLLNVIQYSTKDFNKSGVRADYITLQQLWDATPFGDNGWKLQSGLEVFFHRNRSN